MENLWKIIELEKSFVIKDKYGMTKKIDALKNINIDIEKGETLGIIGESGSGKTTLGKIIIKLIEPDKGKIIFKNTDITNIKEKNSR